MDFSDAQRAGFINAYIRFSDTNTADYRSRGERQAAAERLLKGCEQHYRASVTRVAKNHGVVPFEKEGDFRKLALRLLDKELTAAEYTATVSTIYSNYPRLEDWMRWWDREAHASLIFPARYVMDPHMAKSLPATTNAEESMHNKIYSAIGRAHNLMDGLTEIVRFCGHYKTLYEASLRTCCIISFSAFKSNSNNYKGAYLHDTALPSLGRWYKPRLVAQNGIEPPNSDKQSV
jgi:hypothetical protein